MKRLTRTMAAVCLAALCLAAATLADDTAPQPAVATAQAAVPAITNVWVEYDPNTPDWAWVTVAVDNLDPTNDQSTLFVKRSPSADPGQGQLRSQDEYMVRPDGTFFFGMWLPDAYFPVGSVRVELDVQCNGAFSSLRTFETATPAFELFWQEQSGYTQYEVELYATTAVAEADEPKPVTPSIRAAALRTPDGIGF